MASESSGVGGEEVGREAFGLVEKPGGGDQGVGGRVKSLQGIDIPGVVELPWGEETPRVTAEGGGVPGEDRRGGY